MFKSIGLYEGSIWIEVFHDGDEYYFNEVGYRYGGSISVYPIDYLSGINQIYRDLYYAIVVSTGREKRQILFQKGFRGVRCIVFILFIVMQV